MRKYTTCCLLKIWARFFNNLTKDAWYHFDTTAGYVSAFQTKSLTSLSFLLRRLHRYIILSKPHLPVGLFYVLITRLLWLISGALLARFALYGAQHLTRIGMWYDVSQVERRANRKTTYGCAAHSPAEACTPFGGVFCFSSLRWESSIDRQREV